MNIREEELKNLKPYERNPRKNDDAVDAVKASIKEFGFKVPIVVDKNNVIVAGHTRYKAAMKLGLTTVPIVVADDLTDQQVKAFRLADNKVGELAKWDNNLLLGEVSELFDIDLTDFGFDFGESNEKESYFGAERERTNDAYNLDLLFSSDLTNDFWQMPTIYNDNFVPSDLIGFNYAKSSKEKNCGIHFYVDDYQFERVWNKPEKYVDILKEYQCILSPDFSLYMDMPMPMKIWNIYRSRVIGAFYQSEGIKVIPTLSWAEEETFKFCFLGIPKGSIVSVSTIGVKENNGALKIWKSGMEEMFKQIEPSTILLYGGKLDFDYGDAEVICFDNKVTKEWK